MAKEYIERNNLIDYLTKATGHKATCDGCCDIDCVDCIRDEVIKNIPAADVVEVKHGEWLDNGDRDRNGVPKPFAISCSVCGSSAGTDWMKYCPNCGAKMDGERRKEDG